MAAVWLWTVAPLAALHLWMLWRSRELLRLQLLLDLLLVAAVGPALVLGADLSPIRCLDGTPPYTEWRWSDGTADQPTQSDLVRQIQPWMEETRGALLAGGLPLVSERIGGGLPLLANGQTGVWAPLNLPVWALGPERGPAFANDLLELRELESVTAEDRGNQTGMLLRTASGLLPVGTRSATVTMVFVGASGQGSWGVADSIGLSLSSTQVADVVWPGGATGLQLAVAPAPARGETYIAFTLPADGRVRVEVLDVTGRRVALLADGVRPAGQYEIRWSPRDSGAEAGVYFVRLASSSGTRARRLVTLAR